MANFITAYRITRDIEGGYHGGTGLNSLDRGGETFKGIARRHNPDWAGWGKIDLLKQRPGFPNTALNDPEINRLVLSLYKTKYWDVNRLDDFIIQPVANEMFDTGVNMGPQVAARMLQNSLNFMNRNGRSWQDLTVDGIIGPRTLGVLHRLSIDDRRVLFNMMNILQGERYLGIWRSDPTQEEFLRGWLLRIELMQRG